MITVEMVLEKGFEFVAHDVINVAYPENDPDYQVIENRYLVDVNEKNPPWHDCDVKKFAWRDNKGEMPCDGELWVEIEFKIGGIRQIVKAEDTRWRRRDAGGDIIKWRPSFKNWEREMNLDKIETQEEKESFEGMANSSEAPNSSEWDGEGLPPVGVECEKIFDGRSQIVTPLYYDDHKYGMVMFYCKGIGNSAASDYDWCLVENCVFRKLETPEQKAEREREEWAQNVIGELMHSTGLDFTNDGDIQVVKAMYDLNYRKQNG